MKPLRCSKCRKMTEKEARQLAVDIVEGKVFGTWQLENMQLARLTFLPLALATNIPSDTAHAYEHSSEARTGISGNPVFGSCHLISQQDWERVVDLTNSLLDKRNAFLEGESSETATL